jgi:hypothetical protein
MHWAGGCRGQITAYKFGKVPSGAIVLNITARIDEYWDPDEKAWMDCRPNEFEIDGALWLWGTDENRNKLNQIQATALIRHCGWDRSSVSLQEKTWQPTPCGFTTELNKYKNDGSYHIVWINGYEEVPQGGQMSAEDAQALDNRYGGELAALAGNVARAETPPPSGAPATPPPAKAPTPTPKATPPAEAPADAPAGASAASDIPF